MKITLLSMAVLFGLAGALCADQTLYFESVSGTFPQQPGGHVYGAESYYGPYYISPYFGRIDNNPSGSTVLFCIDFDHYINLGDQTTAVFRTLPSSDTFQDSHYQFGQTTTTGNASKPENNFISGALPTGADISELTAYQRYEGAIWLLYEDLTLPGPPVNAAKSRALYQYAMWAMFLQNGSPDGNAVYRSAIQTIDSYDATFGSEVNSLILGAYSEVKNNQSFIKSLLPYFTVIDSIYNPAPIGKQYQEFLSPNVSPADLPGMPEPSGIVLLGTTILAAGFLWRRRRAA